MAQLLSLDLSMAILYGSLQLLISAVALWQQWHYGRMFGSVLVGSSAMVYLNNYETVYALRERAALSLEVGTEQL